MKPDTMLSSLNTQLAAYTGNALEALTEAASNDDVNKNILQCSISFAASQGTTYHIAVDGYLGARGSVIVRWQPTPTNDNFADALPLRGLSEPVLKLKGVPRRGILVAAKAARPAHPRSGL